jgi:uncharacterized protein involved in response to NO
VRRASSICAQRIADNFSRYNSITMANSEDAAFAPEKAEVNWRSEPFRLFFPLGVLFAWVGVGHWLLYTTGVSSTYSCKLHGMIQMQAFMMAFAVGFLLTALPRRTQTPAVSAGEMVAFAAALAITTAGALAGQWLISEMAYAGVFLLLAQFAIRRFIGRAAGRRPPAAFVMVPIAALHGILGAGLVAAAEFQNVAPGAGHLGMLFIEQGVFLCLAVGIGGLILPLMSGTPPPPDLGSSPREWWKAIAYGIAGAAIFLSFILEQVGLLRVGPILRAIVVALGLGLGGGAWRPPGKAGLHRKLVWLATWMMPLGLIASAIWLDYRVPALHILFIGGFGLMAFGVATHVSLTHLDLQRQALGRPPAIILMAAAFAFALFMRFTADASDTYFRHLGWASGVWIFGSAAWLVFLGPKLLRR